MTTLKDLKPNPKNPRTITDAKLKQLKKALIKFGDLGGFVYNTKTKQLVGGHQRAKVFPKSEIVITRKYQAPTKSGTTAEGFVRLNGERFKYREVAWDEITEKAANLAANKGAGEWDESILGDWFKDLRKASFDLDTTMFDSDERESFLNTASAGSGDGQGSQPVKGEDDAPAVPKKIISKLGDIIVLGQHRLMCGDATRDKHRQKLIRGKGINLLFTDPPYGINIVHRNSVGIDAMAPGYVGYPNQTPSKLVKSRLYRPVIGDDKPFDPAFLLAMKVKRTILWGANHYASRLPSKSQWLVWDKKLESGSLDGNNFSDCELAWTDTDAKATKIYRHVWAGLIRTGNRQDELKERVHPNQKPVGLNEQILKEFSEEGDTVLDLFGGSGSTLIACEKTNRHCFMMEIDPSYCDVIVKRWEDFTGNRAKRL